MAFNPGGLTNSQINNVELHVAGGATVEWIDPPEVPVVVFPDNVMLSFTGIKDDSSPTTRWLTDSV